MTYPFFVGLDLGQAQDYTALAVLERRALAPDRGGHRVASSCRPPGAVGFRS